jgi:UDPglucose 6-dehydrogenase
VLGLAFKPGTDDLRDSPALAVIGELKQRGAKIRSYDPLITSLPGIRVCSSVEEALAGVDAAIIVTAWPEFAALDWPTLAQKMRRPVLIDGRNVLREATLPKTVTYLAIGRHFAKKRAAHAN